MQNEHVKILWKQEKDWRNLQVISVKRIYETRLDIFHYLEQIQEQWSLFEWSLQLAKQLLLPNNNIPVNSTKIKDKIIQERYLWTTILLID